MRRTAHFRAFDLHRDLLGDFVACATGSDLRIERFRKRTRGLGAITLGGIRFQYSHSTRAFLSSTQVGGAHVFRSCSDAEWRRLTNGRMKAILALLGFRILLPRFDRGCITARRAIVSPALEPRVLIFEQVSLARLCGVPNVTTSEPEDALRQAGLPRFESTAEVG
jgi:hypothetical protein